MESTLFKILITFVTPFRRKSSELCSICLSKKRIENGSELRITLLSRTNFRFIEILFRSLDF